MLCFAINLNKKDYTLLTTSKYLENALWDSKYVHYTKYVMFGKYILKTFFCSEMHNIKRQQYTYTIIIKI